MNERRKKRFARNKTSPSPEQQKRDSSPLVLSPKPIQPEQVIPVAIPTNSQQIEVKSTKTAPITKNPIVTPSISQLKQALESKNDTPSTIKVARPSPINKDIKPLNSRYPSYELKCTTSSVTKKEEALPSQPSRNEITTKPIDKSLLNKYNSNGTNDSNTQSQPQTHSFSAEIPAKEKRDSYPLVKKSPAPTTSIVQEKRASYSSTQTPNTPTTPMASGGLEARKQALFTSNSSDNKNAALTSPKKDVQSRYRPNTSRESSVDSSLKKENPLPSSTLLKTRPPPRVASLPNNDTPTNNFLLEAKQKLFAVQQQQRQIQPPVKKTLPVAPMVRQQSGQVSSFISAFETPAVKSPPPKLPQHFELPSTPSLSTPLTPPANKIVPVTSNSSMLPRQQSESYFSTVIDRRSNNLSPTGSEDSIQMYLPQLSPELSFCNNSMLDVPSSDDEEEEEDGMQQGYERPCIKKRVSFSEQLSTVIPDDESEVTEDDQSSINNSMTRFTRTLSQELMQTSTALAAEKKVNVLPRDKYLPVPIVKKPVVVPRPTTIQNQQQPAPQKLSNKLLDMFQKKPKAESKASTTLSSPPPKLTHLTKSRPRKPPSLKKPTTLTYPAAIAQPDWRTRAIGAKNIYRS